MACGIRTGTQTKIKRDQFENSFAEPRESKGEQEAPEVNGHYQDNNHKRCNLKLHISFHFGKKKKAPKTIKEMRCCLGFLRAWCKQKVSLRFRAQVPTHCGRILVVIRNRWGCRISCLWPCEGYECRAEIDIFDSLVALSLPAMAVNLVVFEE